MNINKVKAVENVNQGVAKIRRNKIFHRSPIASFVASVVLLTSGVAQAAEPTIEELQAEISRLKSVIAQQNSSTPTPTPAAGPSATAPVTQPVSPVTPARDVAKPQQKPVVLNTVTVRSRNRIERLQDVPLSVSVVTGKELERLQATDINSITQRVANVSWNLGNQRTSSLRRGEYHKSFKHRSNCNAQTFRPGKS
ncbi:MAG: hypothetical protein EOO68_33365 [Moraxellaceae bacterium]|nr:MAG: hypothetical protein EOO68_33365 [Moraxellaceae bacterium]